jgi:hypothetical protein
MHSVEEIGLLYLTLSDGINQPHLTFPLTFVMSGLAPTNYHDAWAKRTGIYSRPCRPSPSSPQDLEVIRTLSPQATISHNFSAPRPSNKLDNITDVTYNYLCDGKRVAYDASAIVTDCLSELLSINGTIGDPEIVRLKERVEIALRTLNGRQNDVRPVYVDWIEQSMTKGSEKSLGTLTVRSGEDSGTFGTVLLTGTPRARLLRVWEQSVADGTADARWSFAVASHRTDTGEPEGLSNPALEDPSTPSAHINVDGATNSVAHVTLRRFT